MEPTYGLNRSFPNTTLEEAKKRITASLKEVGFGILTEIDVAATLKKKLNVDFRPYLILGACNPPIAHQALSAEPGIGLLLPCNVVVTEDGKGAALVSIAKPEVMFKAVSNPDLLSMVDQVTAKLTQALEKA